MALPKAPKEISQEEIDKVRPEVAKEQAVLLLNLQEVIKEALLHRPTRRGYKHFSCIYSENPTFLHNQMFANNFSSILNLRPYQLAMFTPKLRFYKKVLKNNSYVEISFDSFAGSGKEDPATAAADRYDPRKIMDGDAFHGSGIGIQRFEWKLSGDITDTPDKRLQTYAADLTLRMENINELFVTRTDESGRKYSAQELFAPERGRDEKADENQYKILVEVGWNVAKGAVRDNEIYQSIGEEALEDIEKTTVRFELSLINHDINFNQDGSISLTLNYIASLAASAKNPMFSNLKGNQFKDQIRANVIEKAIAEARKSEDKAVKAQAEAFLSAKRIFDNAHEEVATSGGTTSSEHKESLGSRRKDVDVGGNMNYLMNHNKEAELAFQKMSKIYAKYEQEHRSDIDARAREAASAMNCKWIVNNLLELNRIKMFQVRKENILHQQKIIRDKKIRIVTGATTIRGAGHLDAFPTSARTKVVDDSPPGYKKGPDDVYTEIGVEVVQGRDGRLKGMLMLEEELKMLSTADEDGKADLDIAKIKVIKLTASGNDRVYYRLVTEDPSGTKVQEYNNDPVGRKNMMDYLALYSGQADLNNENISDEAAVSVAEAIIENSDAVYRVDNFVEKIADLAELEGEATDTKKETISGVDTLGGTKKTGGLEDIDNFRANLFNQISVNRSSRGADGEYLNIRYVTVGDIFDAFLAAAYQNDPSLREHKFLMGPVVVNEAKGVIGTDSDFTIQYKSRDADLNVVLEKDSDGKNSIFEQEKRKNREDKIYNLADLPISFDNLLLWVQKNITENKNPFMTFDKFVSSLLSSMLDDAYSQVGEYRQILPKANFGTEMDTFMLLDEKQTSAKYPDADFFGLLDGRQKEYGPEKHPSWNSRIKVDNKTSDLLREKMPKTVSHETHINNRNVTNYHLITSRCRFPANRVYNYTGDMKDGIPHFFVGQDSGIIKSIEFEQADIPGQLESNVLNAMAAAEESTSPAAVYLRKPYNATINMVGNPFFSRGQMLFINPSMAGVGSLGRSNSAAATLGLGGYYRVVEISNSIDASGKYETQLGCIWQSYGAGKNGMTVDKAEDAAKMQAIPKEVLDRGLTGLLRTYLQDDAVQTNIVETGYNARRFGTGELDD
jgi:hypothetical protein